MCERKPGPRCSSDTIVALRAANKELEEAKVKEAEWEQTAKTDPTNPDFYEEIKSGYGGLVHEARLRKEKASLLFDATPDGLASIQSLIATSGNAVTVREIALYDEDDIVYHGRTQTFVSVRVPVNKSLENRINVAKEHREWQGKASRLLADSEKESLHKALFVAGRLREELESNIPRNIFSSKWVNDIREYGIKNAEGGEQTIARNILHNNRAQLQRQYHSIKIEDLKSYEKSIAAKIEAVTKKPILSA